MRILIMSQYFYPENFRLNDLAIKLRDRDNKVTVVTGNPNYPNGKFYDGYSGFRIRTEVLNGIEIIRIPLIPRFKSKGWQLALNYLSFCILTCLLSPFLLKGRNFDIIFSASYSPATANIPAIFIKKIKKIPLILWVQDLWPESLSATNAVKSKLILKKVEGMMRWIYNQSDLILTQSPAFKGPISKIADCDHKINDLPNWAEDIFTQEIEQSSVVLPDGFNIVFAGNLGQAQSLEVIVDAAELSYDSPINWIILGDGRRADWFRSQVEDRGLSGRFCFLGRKPIEMMPAYFSSADAMLVTLSPDPIVSKTIPGKIQSYLACGRPILGALDGEGARVINESGAGFTVPSENAAALAAAAKKMMLLSNSKREELGRNGYDYYTKHFDSKLLLTFLENEIIKLTRHEA